MKKMNRLFKMLQVILVIVCLVFSPILSSAQTPIWERTAGGNSLFNEGIGISTDASGNSYVTGTMDGVINFTSTHTFVCSNNDIFIAKYNSVGTLQWVKQAGGTDVDYGLGICTDATGNSYITGYCDASAQFDTYTVPTGAFIAKYDANGTCQWATSLTASSSIRGKKVSIDAAGNLYVMGDFHGTAYVGSCTITSSAIDDRFIAKFDAQGNCIWVVNSQGCTAIHASSGNLYITGIFENSRLIGATTLNSNGKDDVYIAKLDGVSGNALWATSGGGPDNDQAFGVVANSAGIVLAVGTFYNNATFGSVTLFKSAAQEGFLLECDASGNPTKGLQGSFGRYVTLDGSSTPYTSSNPTCFDNAGNILKTGEVTGCQWTSTSLAKCIYVRKYKGLVDIYSANKNLPDLKVFPNPCTTTNFTVEIVNTELDGELSITDVMGKVVYDDKVTSSLSNFQLKIPTGAYVLKYQSMDGIQYLKLIIQ